jgi:hypothetical protein
MKGLIPSIIFGSFIFIIIVMLSLAVFRGDEVRDYIKEGMKNEVPVPVSSQ